MTRPAARIVTSLLVCSVSASGWSSRAAAPIKITQVSKAIGPLVEASFGIAVAGAGDVNGDGFADVVVSERERHYLFLGSPQGLSSSPVWTLPSTAAADGTTGRAVGAGDVNGDGYADLLIGMLASPGAAMVFHGSATGLGASPDWTVAPILGGSGCGFYVAGAGDVNGDGYADVLVSQRHGPDQNFDGVVALYLGSATGLQTTHAWHIQGLDGLEEYGRGISGVGDLDRDGFDDVMVGAPGTDAGMIANAGTVFVFFGSASGLEPTARWSIKGAGSNAPYGGLLGRMVREGGDIDGDGFGELLIGDDEFIPAGGTIAEGQATVTYGTADGLEPSFTWDTQLFSPGARWGDVVAGVGDMDADGFDDIVVGARLYPNMAGRREGYVRLFAGSATGPVPTWELYGENPGDHLADGLAAAGDVNGDGRPDFVVSSPLHVVNGEERGAAYLLSACTEADDDSVCDFVDNCPGAANTSQVDSDADAAGDACDCAATNDLVWSPPGPVEELALLPAESGSALLTWSAPASPGGTEAFAYDLLRTGNAADFLSAADCLPVDGDGSSASATDTSVPAAGGIHFYLPRARNSCGAGIASLGLASDGTPRLGRSCP